jgi:DNA-binding NtrC family response regulator
MEETAQSHRYIILVAIEEQFLRKAVSNRLTYEGYAVQEVITVNEARSIIIQQRVSCVVMTSQFAVPDETNSLGVMALLVNRIPTVTLLSRDVFVSFDEIYCPPLHEYETLPCDLDYLTVLVAQVLSHTNDKN